MPPRQLHLQVAIGMDTALPADTVVNNWSFLTDGSGTAVSEATGAFNRLQTFYQAIDGLMPQQVNPAGFNVKAYDRADPEPRAPIINLPFTGMVTGVGESMPSEICVVMSFHAAFGSGIVAARRRGRVFIGPLRTGQEMIANGGSRPENTLRTTIKDAGAALMAANTSALSWGVRTDMDDITAPVVGGYVDDAWDIQRRRGLAPTLRTAWGV